MFVIVLLLIVVVLDILDILDGLDAGIIHIECIANAFLIGCLGLGIHLANACYLVVFLFKVDQSHALGGASHYPQ